MLSDMSVSQPETAFRRAMIAVKPDYFSLAPAAQERYRLAMPKEDYVRVQQMVLKSLFDIQVDTKQKLDAVLKSFGHEHYLIFNRAMLFFQGLGDDHFYLNDYLGENTTLLDFETLYAYDYDNHCFQEKARKEEQPDYVIRPYRGTLYGLWARLHIDGAFSYSSLWMVAKYLNSRVEEIGFDKIRELIPHEYVDGKEHGKREGKGTLWDTKLVAGGKEGQLEELKHRFYSYLIDNQELLLDNFDAKAQKQVYLVSDNWDDDPHMNFIFTDQTALQSVCFRHFMADCQRIVGDNRELDALIEQERQGVVDFLERNYQDIMENFDPKVTKLRKRRRIIIADGALDGLL